MVQKYRFVNPQQGKPFDLEESFKGSIQVDLPQILDFYLLSTVVFLSAEQTLKGGYRRTQHLFPLGDFDQ